MAQNKTITFKGMQRAVPQSLAPDGSCHEVINARIRKGCWRPVGDKMPVFDHELDLSGYDKVFLHDIEGGRVSGESNWIGIKIVGDHAELHLIHQDSPGNFTIINSNIDLAISPKVSFLKRTMIVITGVGLLNYIWTGIGTAGNYASLDILPVPDVTITTFDHQLIESEHFHEPDAILGALAKVLNTQSEETGRMFGSIMYIAAYRLFDGSYILHSIPKYLNIRNNGIIEQNNPDGNSQSDSKWWWEIYLSRLRATLKNQYSTTYTDVFIPIKDIVESICVFATKCTLLHQIDDTTFTEAKLYQWFGTGTNNRELSYMFPVSENFKALPKSIGWYKIQEFLFSDLVERNDMNVVNIDTKGYYQDYATRDTLPIDQYSHHTNIARFAYSYNDRLHLLNIKTSLGLPYVVWDNPFSLSGESGTMPVRISVWIKTTLGQSVVQSDGLAKFYSFDFSNYFIIPSLVGYNDSRAYRMQIAVFNGSDYVLLFDEKLTKNELMNYAVWTNNSFNPVDNTPNANFTAKKVVVTSLSNIATIPSVIKLPFDTNRLQVSEIQNPLVFPAKNSYQIGTGDGLAMAAGSEPLSTGQFGQFPLQVFTSKGIWTLEIGTGDVLYTNILPLNAEVINNPDNVVAISSGVSYTTDMGLFVINGREVIELAEMQESQENSLSLQTNEDVEELTSNIKYVPTLANSLSDTDFITYLQGSKIGYDHLNKELIVTNYAHAYTMVYSFENQVWYKLSRSFRLLINSYPKLFGVTDVNVLSLSEESNANPVDVFIMSSAQGLEAPDAFKKIERAIFRTKFSTDVNCQAGFYLFASDDLFTWQFITGKQKTGTGVKDLLIQRSHGSAKFYAFIFAGRVYTNSEIKQIELIYNIRWNNRLR